MNVFTGSCIKVVVSVLTAAVNTPVIASGGGETPHHHNNSRHSINTNRRDILQYIVAEDSSATHDVDVRDTCRSGVGVQAAHGSPHAESNARGAALIDASKQASESSAGRAATRQDGCQLRSGADAASQGDLQSRHRSIARVLLRHRTILAPTTSIHCNDGRARIACLCR